VAATQVLGDAVHQVAHVCRAALCAAGLSLCAGSAATALRELAPGPSTAPLAPGRQPPPLLATVEVALEEPLSSFSPERALGAALDGHEQGETARIYTRSNVRAMAAAGLGDVSYRLRTELGVQAWHANAAGRFSDAAGREGYWTSAERPSGPSPSISWGYRLPRRGDTVDQADDNGYSRLDDGDLHTFWKSDPYLDSHFTHEPDQLHPQWVLVDLGRPRPLDALRIAWAQPYATRFSVQLYVGPSAVMLAGHPPGHWRDFPRGSFAGRRGLQTLRLAPTPVTARFVRVLMYSSSHTAMPTDRRSIRSPIGQHDMRDRLGYAIDELYLGTLEGRGGLRDLLVHRSSKSQTTVYVSSTDPWHRSSDRNPGYEQPSFQTVMRSGLTRGAPLLVPVGVLYGTPRDAVAELRYLRALRVPIKGVELGEEPDGQLAAPEDYGALYIQFARAIHRAFPKLPIGGPSLQTSIPDWLYWPDARGDRSWTHRFLDYLRAHRAMGLLSFFSFEWYPYDDVCAPPGPQLAGASDLLTRTLSLQREHGLPTTLPVYISEYGYSAFAGQDEVDLPGALLDADTVGTFLADGGATAYLYGYEPDGLLQESERCTTWGNLALLQGDGEHPRPRPLATFWETSMLTHDWVEPGNGKHTLYATSSSATDAAGHELVRAYALRRPDGSMSVLLLNVSPTQPYEVSVRLTRRLAGAESSRAPDGPLREWQLSAASYRWSAAGSGGHPTLDLPPVHNVLSSGSSAVRLPPYSITVITTPPG
jgi:F5/8 type C domain